jgi:hypothetical protein
LFYWLSNVFSRFTAINISSISFFILHDHALSMIAVNDCVCMNFSLLFSLFPHVNTIHTYIYIKRVNETEQEKARERGRENLNTHQRRDTSERLYIYTLANYDYDTRVCKRASTTNERVSERVLFSHSPKHMH